MTFFIRMALENYLGVQTQCSGYLKVSLNDAAYARKKIMVIGRVFMKIFPNGLTQWLVNCRMEARYTFTGVVLLTLFVMPSMAMANWSGGNVAFPSLSFTGKIMPGFNTFRRVLFWSAAEAKDIGAPSLNP